MKYLLIVFVVLFVTACDDPAPVEQVTTVEVDQSRMLELENLKQTYLEKTAQLVPVFESWQQLVAKAEIIESDFAQGQTVRVRKFLDLDLEGLDIEDFPELFVLLDNEQTYLKNNLSLVSQWLDSKAEAKLAQSNYRTALQQRLNQQDEFDTPLWEQAFRLEQEENYRGAQEGYQIIAQHCLNKLAHFNAALDAQQSATLAMKKWQQLDGKLSRFSAQVAKLEGLNAEARDWLSSLQFDGAKDQWQAVAEQWLQLYENGLTYLTMPKLVTLKGGVFNQGDEVGNGDRDELPLQRMRVPDFKMSMTEITFAQYDAYAKANGLPLPNDEGWGRGNRPVINVSWKEAQAFAQWLSERSGKVIRLPYEAEWEYAAKANQTDPFSMSTDVGNLANCEGCYRWSNTQTTPVAQFPANGFGLYDMQGNVWEWTADCYRVPESEGQCEGMAVRGGSWYDMPNQLRASNRSTAAQDKASNRIGFRLVEAITAEQIVHEPLDGL